MLTKQKRRMMPQKMFFCLVLCCVFLEFGVTSPAPALAGCPKDLKGASSLYATAKAKGQHISSFRLTLYHPTPGREKRVVLKTLQAHAGAFMACFESQKGARKDLTFDLTITQGGKIRSIQRCSKTKPSAFSRCLQNNLQKARFTRARKSGLSHLSVRFVLFRETRKEVAKKFLKAVIKKYMLTPPHDHHFYEKSHKKRAPRKKAPKKLKPRKVTTQPTTRPR